MSDNAAYKRGAMDMASRQRKKQSVNIYQRAAPVQGKEGSRGLSLRSLRLSIAPGRILTPIVVILCIALSFPHSDAKHHERLLQNLNANNVTELIVLACNATESPQACQSSLSSSPSAMAAQKSDDIVEAAIQLALQGEQQSHSLAQELLNMTGKDVNLTTAAQICEYLLGRASGRFGECQAISLSTRAKDMETWMSAALTYENDCRSALSYVNTTQFVNQIMRQIDGVITLTSNALSMVDAYDSYGPDPSKWKAPSRSSFLAADSHWLTIVNRRLLQTDGADGINPAVIVSKDGLGNYTSVQAAVDAAPENANERFVIYIKEGIYNETVRIPYSKTSLTFVGDGMNKTVITGNRNAQMPGVTTYTTATVAVDGDGFIARDITFENTAGPELHQAVALRVDSDLSAFHNCSFLGHQDTLYTHSLRQFYRNCRIEGTIDFIFGNAASIFQNCEILVRPGRVPTSVVTAQGRTDPAETTGLVFQKCIINGTQEYMESYYLNPNQHTAYLGRPWKMYSRTIFIDTYMEKLIRPEGWLPWNGAFALDTLFYGEYNSSGPGANATARVPWSDQISLSEATLYSISGFIQGDQWLPATNVPFDPLFGA